MAIARHGLLSGPSPPSTSPTREAGPTTTPLASGTAAPLCVSRLAVAGTPGSRDDGEALPVARSKSRPEAQPNLLGDQTVARQPPESAARVARFPGCSSPIAPSRQATPEPAGTRDRPPPVALAGCQGRCHRSCTRKPVGRSTSAARATPVPGRRRGRAAQRRRRPSGIWPPAGWEMGQQCPDHGDHVPAPSTPLRGSPRLATVSPQRRPTALLMQELAGSALRDARCAQPPSSRLRCHTRGPVRRCVHGPELRLAFAVPARCGGRGDLRSSRGLPPRTLRRRWASG